MTICISIGLIIMYILYYNYYNNELNKGLTVRYKNKHRIKKKRKEREILKVAMNRRETR